MGLAVDWTGLVVGLDLLEEPVGDAQVDVIAGIEAGAEAVRDTDGREGGRTWSGWTGFPQGGLQGPELLGMG